MRDYVDGARTARSAGYFATDEKLVKVARCHAEDMFDGSYLRMRSPDGETLADRLLRQAEKKKRAFWGFWNARGPVGRRL